MGCGCGRNKKNKVTAQKKTIVRSINAGKKCPKCGQKMIKIHQFNKSTGSTSSSFKCTGCKNVV